MWQSCDAHSASIISFTLFQSCVPWYRKGMHHHYYQTRLFEWYIHTSLRHNHGRSFFTTKVDFCKLTLIKMRPELSHLVHVLLFTVLHISSSDKNCIYCILLFTLSLKVMNIFPNYIVLKKDKIRETCKLNTFSKFISIFIYLFIFLWNKKVFCSCIWVLLCCRDQFTR